METDPIGGNPFLPTFEAPEDLDRRPRPEDPDGLAPAERALVEAVADGLTPTAAGRAAGYAEGTDVVRRPAVQSALLSAFARRGIDEDRIAKVVNRGLKATRRIYDKAGNLVDEIPDHIARHRYLDTVLTVRGDLKHHENNEESWEMALMMVRGRRGRE